MRCPVQGLSLKVERSSGETGRAAVAATGRWDRGRWRTTQGNFEDFAVGQEILHATPRTVTESDATLYLALTGSRLPCTARRHWRAWPGCRGRRSRIF